MNFKQGKFAIGYLAITLIAILVFQFPLFGPRASPLSYSEFKTLTRKGKASDLIVDRDTVSGTLSTDGLEMLLPKEKVEEPKRGSETRRFVAARADDPGRVAEV